MAYNKTTWQNSPSTSTPINATNLNNMENGIKTNDDKLLGTAVAGDMVVNSIRSKNMFNIYSRYVDSSGASYLYITNGIRVINTQSQDNNYVRFLVLDITNYIGKTLTLSAKAKSSSTNPACMYMRLAKNDGTSGSYGAQLTGTTTDGTLSVSYTIPSGIGDYHYLIVSLYAVRGATASVNSYVDFTEIMLEQSNSMTTYTPYQELNNQELYSIGEVKIGTWINGKSLYRNVYSTTTYSSSNSIPVSNAETIVNVRGFVRRSDYNNIYQMIPGRTNNSGFYSQFNNITADTNNISVAIEFGSSLQSVVSQIILILEYTKTTD